jgi:hypothetical protein
MQTIDVPPSRKSISAQGEVKPFGPHQQHHVLGIGPAFQLGKISEAYLDSIAFKLFPKESVKYPPKKDYHAL